MQVSIVEAFPGEGPALFIYIFYCQRSFSIIQSDAGFSVDNRWLSISLNYQSMFPLSFDSLYNRQAHKPLLGCHGSISPHEFSIEKQMLAVSLLT